MNKIILFLTFITTATSLNGQRILDFLHDENLTFEEKIELAEQYFDEYGKTKHKGYKQYLRWKYFAKKRLDGNGKVISNVTATKEYNAFLKKSSDTNRFMTPWVEEGPLNASNTSTWSSHIGRLTNIGIDPNNDQHLIVTSPGGGVWKTTDEGDTWTPIFDEESSMSVWSSMISHSNSNYYLVGTSGNGIRKSTDGGNTWSSVSGTGGTMYSIKMDPNDDQTIIACSSNGRIYRSVDGGDTWTDNSIHNSSLIDLEIHPNNSNIMYVSGLNGFLAKSTDNGVSWSTLNHPWTNGAIMIAVTNDAVNNLYALRESGGGFGGMYLSTNQGSSWTVKSDDSNNNNNIMGYNLNESGGQAPRDMDIVVSPTNKDEVHVAGIMTFKSTDAGSSWTQTTHWVIGNSLPFVHADIDQLIYQNGKIYVASDGGLFISSDNGATFIDKTSGLGIRQFYRIGAAATKERQVCGGSQDNGTGILKNDIWYDFIGADGMETIIFDHDENLLIGSIQFGGLYRSVDGGATITNIPEASGGNGSWVTPLVKDPILKNTAYQAKRDLYRTTNAGDSWTQISEGIGSGNADELCIAPSNNNIIYMSYDEDLYNTTDGGKTWSNISITGVNYNNINYISINPKDSDHILLATSGNNKILESTDGGSTWSNITLNLPNIGSNCVIFDNTPSNGIYVSMTKGVYYKDDNSASNWTLVGTGLPNTDVTELEIIGDKLYAATYGRGLWQLDIAGNNCHLRPNVELSEINNQGTTDTSDDTFTFSIQPDGLELSGTFDITGDITASNISYSSPYVLDNGGSGFLVDNGALSLTITPNSSNQNCPITLKVNNLYTPSIEGNYLCDSAYVINSTGLYHAVGPSKGEGGTVGTRHANWFKFIPPTNGQLSVMSCGMGEDTNLIIHDGDCNNLNEIIQQDDNCSMGPGLHNYASSIEDINVNFGTEYFIEWDSKWSTDPFDFNVIFIPDCTDDLILHTDGQPSDTYQAENTIYLSGSASNDLNFNATQEVVIHSNMNIADDVNIEIDKNPCTVNLAYDWSAVSDSSRAISDLSTIDIVLNIPDEITNKIQDMDVMIDLEHNQIGDLTIDVISPAGDIFRIWDRYCATEKNLNFITDEAGISNSLCGEVWQSGGYINSPAKIPVSSFNVLYGLPSVGQWIIRIQDLESGNEGTLNKCGLFFR